MRGFFNKRLEALSNPKVYGDIVSNLGIGFLVNSLYLISLGGLGLANFIDILLSIIAIVEGSYAKDKT